MNENKRIKSRVFVSCLMLALLLIMSVAATIAWLADNQEAKYNSIKMDAINYGFNLRVSGEGTIGFTDLDQYITGHDLGTGGTITSDAENEQVIRWRMADGDDELMPGSQGELHFEVVADTAVLSQLNYDIYFTAFEAVTTTQTQTDANNNTVDVEVLTGLNEVTSSSSSTLRNAADNLNGHILFFTNRSGSSNADYVYSGFIKDKSDFSLALNNGAGTIYWIWPNTFGQIALESGDTDYITGMPVLDTSATSYETDRQNLKSYLKDENNKVFAGSESYSALIDLLYNKRASATDYRNEFDLLSEGYNAGDQAIGSNIDYVLVHLLVTGY